MYYHCWYKAGKAAQCANVLVLPPTAIEIHRERIIFRGFTSSQTGIYVFRWPSYSRMGQIPEWDVTYLLMVLGHARGPKLGTGRNP
jgi:hypothetical protein